MSNSFKVTSIFVLSVADNVAKDYWVYGHQVTKQGIPKSPYTSHFQYEVFMHIKATEISHVITIVLFHCVPQQLQKRNNKTD